MPMAVAVAVLAVAVAAVAPDVDEGVGGLAADVVGSAEDEDEATAFGGRRTRWKSAISWRVFMVLPNFSVKRSMAALHSVP